MSAVFDHLVVSSAAFDFLFCNRFDPDVSYWSTARWSNLRDCLPELFTSGILDRSKVPVLKCDQFFGYGSEAPPPYARMRGRGA